MASGSRRFDSVKIDEGWGIAGSTGFHLSDTHCYAAPGSYPFSVCSIDGQHVAVLAEMTVPTEDLVQLASLKPSWLDALVYAKVLSEPRSDFAVIAAHVLKPAQWDPQVCSFAVACVVFNLGLFKVIPRNYLIRFGGGVSVRVSMDFDDGKESWFGEATNEP